MERKAVSRIMLILLSIGVLSLTFNFRQALEQPPTEWTRTYGGTDYDCAYSVIQTSDGGYAISGFTESFGVGLADFWLVKTDSAGNMLWNQTYGGTDSDYIYSAYSAIQTSDGGYALLGNTKSFGAGDYDFWLVKTDGTGTMQWNQTYGGAYREDAECVVQTVDGGYAIAGYTESFGAGLWDIWLVKVAGPPYIYTLTINSAIGGTTDPPAGSYTYGENEVATVTATPDIGYYFDHWQYDGETSSDNPIEITMSQEYTLAPVFAYAPSIPEFPIGLALEILFIPVIIYMLWRNKQKKINRTKFRRYE